MTTKGAVKIAKEFNSNIFTNTKEMVEKVNLIGEFSGDVWAKEFIRIYNEQTKKGNHLWIDVDLMRAWFCNAIMAGYDYQNKALAAAEEEKSGLRKQLFDTAGTQEGIHYLNQENKKLQSEVARLREALQYIIDHKWVVHQGKEWKWINEFVDVAEKELEGGK